VGHNRILPKQGAFLFNLLTFLELLETGY